MTAYHLLFHSDKEFLKGVVSGLFCLQSTPVSCLTLSASTSQVYTAFLSTDTTKALVHAFVTSRVYYCNILLYGLPASHLNKVQRVLNAAARLVCRAPRYCRITPLLYELHWLPVRQRISFKILLFVFKAIHGFAPTYLRELVSVKRLGNYNLRSSSDGLLLATPTYRSRVTLGDRSFQVAAPALWNVLPREIRSIIDRGIFKCHLKTHLFKEAFY